MWQMFLAAGLGAITQEALYWYRLRDKLTLEKHRRTLRAPSYWVPTMVVVVLSGVITPLYLGNGLRLDQLFVAGAAFPAVAKHLFAAAAGAQKGQLGGREAKDPVKLRDYLAAS